MHIEAQSKKNIPHPTAATQLRRTITPSLQPGKSYFIFRSSVCPHCFTLMSQRGTRHPKGFSTFSSGYKYFRARDQGSRKPPCFVARKPSEVMYTFILATER